MSKGIELFSPGQADHFLDRVPARPDWVVIGGPADGDEAQRAVIRWPGVRVLAVEPHPGLYTWQLRNGFPADGVLLQGALTDRDGVTRIRFCEDCPRRSSGVRPVAAGDGEAVRAYTLDSLRDAYGVCGRVALWLDIEGMELQALRGGTALLDDVTALNIEVIPGERPADVDAIHSLLTGAGLTLLEEWNVQGRHHHDRIYVRGRPGGKPIFDPAWWADRWRVAVNAGRPHHSVYKVGDRAWEAIAERHRVILREVLRPADAVLDAGCAYGRLLDLMPTWWGGPYLGVDLSPEMVDAARQTYPRRRFIVGDLRTFTVPWVTGPDYDIAIFISIKGMVIREKGRAEWDAIVANVRKYARRLLVLEYEANGKGEWEHVS